MAGLPIFQWLDDLFDPAVFDGEIRTISVSTEFATGTRLSRRKDRLSKQDVVVRSASNP